MFAKGAVAGLCLTMTAIAGQAMAESSTPPPGTGCGAEMVQSSNPASRAKTEANTKAVALAFVTGTVEAQDKLLAPNALFWALGLGYMDRSQYIAMHNLKSGPARGAPTSHKQTINHVVVQNDLAAIDMENYVVWPDFTYDQKYNTLIQVRGDKICLLKIFSNASMAKAMLPDIEKSIEKQ